MKVSYEKVQIRVTPGTNRVHLVNLNEKGIATHRSSDRTEEFKQAMVDWLIGDIVKDGKVEWWFELTNGEAYELTFKKVSKK